MQTFRVGGSGGQNRDKRDTGVRIIHPPSGAVGEARESRKQIVNKRTAFKRMGESVEFQQWAKAQVCTPVDVEVQSNERIRTYNFVKGYVKDHRTGKQSGDVDGVLNGDLDQIR